ncbi:hypothetical protein GCM10023189_07100 [Nibrella saemangeumensis]|uniref:PD-(D/E)XK nuclease superfamily protein n=1 Tax=Nibrella saemangeumensis TaxID=1084526 RepID=A0ABP8MFK8_9BACT
MNYLSIEAERLPDRIRSAVSLAWSLFAKKVGGRLISINKEASMQLQYAYILQQILSLIVFDEKEAVTLELEESRLVDGSLCEIDILVTGQYSDLLYPIAIELKCYKTYSTTGGKRGATDIFRKDVYEDFAILERYIESNQTKAGISLIMTDMESLIYPKSKKGKCWDYDISDGTIIYPGRLMTPIGGKPVEIELKKQYTLKWLQYGSFWFAEIEGNAFSFGQ